MIWGTLLLLCVPLSLGHQGFQESTLLQPDTASSWTGHVPRHQHPSAKPRQQRPGCPARAEGLSPPRHQRGCWRGAQRLSASDHGARPHHTRKGTHTCLTSHQGCPLTNVKTQSRPSHHLMLITKHMHVKGNPSRTDAVGQVGGEDTSLAPPPPSRD